MLQVTKKQRCTNIVFCFAGEKQCSIHQDGERWDATKARVVGATEIQPDDEIKIVRKGCIRWVQ